MYVYIHFTSFSRTRGSVSIFVSVSVFVYICMYVTCIQLYITCIHITHMLCVHIRMQAYIWRHFAEQEGCHRIGIHTHVCNAYTYVCMHTLDIILQHKRGVTVFVCICMYIHVSIYICTRTWMCIFFCCICMYTHWHKLVYSNTNHRWCQVGQEICLYVYICVCSYICIRKNNFNLHACFNVCFHASVCLCMEDAICLHAYVYMFIYTYVCLHIEGWICLYVC